MSKFNPSTKLRIDGERSRTIKIKIDKERCKGCELCIIFCPKQILRESEKLNKKGIHFAELKNQDSCTGCSNCAVICPECAIEIISEG